MSPGSRGRLNGNDTERSAEMGKIVVTEFISLDGVIEDPGGSEGTPNGGWTFEFDAGDGFGEFKSGELMASDAQLLGRVTYEGFAKAWPTMEGTGEFGVKMNSMPKYVVSSTLSDPTWENTTVVGPDLAAEVAALKDRYDGDVLVAGSATLAQGLLAADLVDELRLMTFPVVLGAGKRLFGELPEKKKLTVSEIRPLDDGVTLSIYTRA
jgi:dihydrofolate reductase